MSDIEIIKQIINKLYPLEGERVTYNPFYFLDEEFIDLLKQLNKEN